MNFIRLGSGILPLICFWCTKKFFILTTGCCSWRTIFLCRSLRFGIPHVAFYAQLFKKKKDASRTHTEEKIEGCLKEQTISNANIQMHSLLV